jgi:hypothetical protein
MYAKLVFIFSFALVGTLAVSCFKSEEFPVEPVISDPSFVINGDSAVLSFYFTDGDGDIGLGPDNIEDEQPPYDTSSYYYYNIYCDYYEKDDVNGWQQGTDLSGNPISFTYRIHRIIVKGKQRGIKGTIDIALESFQNPFSSQSDTIKYTVKLIDRALNESNVIETEMIVP